MSRPHEETWSASLEKIDDDAVDRDDPLWMVLDAEGHLVADTTTDEAAAKLIAAAPAMARALIHIVSGDANASMSRDEQERIEVVLRRAGVLT